MRETKGSCTNTLQLEAYIRCDHTGCDYTGCDHTGRDHTGRDYTGRDYTGRDHTGRDYTGRDYTGRDYTRRDHTGHDHTGRDYTGRDHTGCTIHTLCPNLLGLCCLLHLHVFSMTIHLLNGMSSSSRSVQEGRGWG